MVDNISETNSFHYVIGYLVAMQASVNMTGLFPAWSFFYFLAQGGVQCARIFPSHSRIIPFYSRNFTFITQEINEHLTQEVWGSLSMIYVAVQSSCWLLLRGWRVLKSVNIKNNSSFPKILFCSIRTIALSLRLFNMIVIIGVWRWLVRKVEQKKV